VENCISPEITSRSQWDGIFDGGNGGFDATIEIYPPSTFKLKSGITKDDIRWKAFVAKAIQYSEVLAAKGELDKLCAEINNDCASVFFEENRMQISQSTEVKECFDTFSKKLRAALKQRPLNEYFPECTDMAWLRNFTSSTFEDFLKEFLQFAEASSAPNGELFVFFNSKMAPRTCPSELALNEFRKQIDPISTLSSNHDMDLWDQCLDPCMDKFRELMGAFMENLKTCLLSGQVKFKFPMDTREMTFRERFADTANGWLDRATDDQQTHRAVLSALRKRYDNALKVFQEPLAEERAEPHAQS
jgi:hypothetical protein